MRCGKGRPPPSLGPVCDCVPMPSPLLLLLPPHSKATPPPLAPAALGHPAVWASPCMYVCVCVCVRAWVSFAVLLSRPPPRRGVACGVCGLDDAAPQLSSLFKNFGPQRPRRRRLLPLLTLSARHAVFVSALHQRSRVCVVGSMRLTEVADLFPSISMFRIAYVWVRVRARGTSFRCSSVPPSLLRDASPTVGLHLAAHPVAALEETLCVVHRPAVLRRVPRVPHPRSPLLSSSLLSIFCRAERQGDGVGCGDAAVGVDRRGVDVHVCLCLCLCPRQLGRVCSIAVYTAMPVNTSPRRTGVRCLPPVLLPPHAPQNRSARLSLIFLVLLAAFSPRRLLPTATMAPWVVVAVGARWEPSPDHCLVPSPVLCLCVCVPPNRGCACAFFLPFKGGRTSAEKLNKKELRRDARAVMSITHGEACVRACSSLLGVSAGLPPTRADATDASPPHTHSLSPSCPHPPHMRSAMCDQWMRWPAVPWKRKRRRRCGARGEGTNTGAAAPRSLRRLIEAPLPRWLPGLRRPPLPLCAAA